MGLDADLNQFDRVETNLVRLQAVLAQLTALIPTVRAVVERIERLAPAWVHAGHGASLLSEALPPNTVALREHEFAYTGCSSADGSSPNPRPPDLTQHPNYGVRTWRPQ